MNIMSHVGVFDMNDIDVPLPTEAVNFLFQLRRGHQGVVERESPHRVEENRPEPFEGYFFFQKNGIDTATVLLHRRDVFPFLRRPDDR